MAKWIQQNKKLINKKYNHPYAWFWNDVYKFSMFVIWDVDNDQYKAWMKEKYGLEDDFVDRSGVCHTIKHNETGSIGYLIALREYKHDDPYLIGVLAHEVNHIVQRVLDSRGMDMNEHTVEAYCYLTEWLMRSCVEVMLQK